MKKTTYGGLKFLSFLFPFVAIIFYFIEVDKNPKKADACFSGIIYSIIVSVIIVLISIVVFASLKNDSLYYNNNDDYYEEESY